jgi:hypothetical protein
LVLAELPTLSRIYLLFQPRLLDPLQEDLPRLDRISFLDRRHTLPNLPPCQAGWRRFGMQAGTWRLEMLDLGVALTDTAWAFVFDWKAPASAWQAFLETQEQVRPEKLSLHPRFLLPTIFLTRMAYFPIGPGLGNDAAAWTPVFAEAHTMLAPLIHALYVHWMRGPSQAAARYRRLTGASGLLTSQEETVLAQFHGLAGATALNAIQQAERLEPILIRTLEATSTWLWNTPRRLRPDRLVRSLLPLACWREASPGPEELERRIPQSTQGLAQLWRRWQARGQGTARRDSGGPGRR